MKNFLLHFTTVVALTLSAVSCEDSGDLDDYLPPIVAGEDSSYNPEIVAVIPGYERAEIVWRLNEGDRTIENTYICWNAGEDIYEATISESTYDESSGYYRQIVEVSEGTHIFFARNLDSDKYISAISPMFEATIYGATAQSELLDRPVSDVDYNEDYSRYIITWGESETCVGSTVNYTTMTGQKAEKHSVSEDESVELISVEEDVDITITSLYLPYRAQVADGYEDVLASLDMEGAGLDTLSCVGTTQTMRGTGTQFIYVSSLEELWELLNDWEDHRTDEEKAAGDPATAVSYHEATREQLIANLAKKSNVNLKMKPGVYTIDSDIAGTVGINGVTHPIFYRTASSNYSHHCVLVTGNNNYFDFTGVEIQVETSALSSFRTTGSGALRHLYIVGNDNIVEGLTLRDVGDPEVDPENVCTNVVIDGRRNTLLECNIYPKGSKPYFYGELFGKGSSYTISHNKHNGLLIGGKENTIRRCSLKSDAYGHLVYMQGSHYATIEECYIEGAFSTTDAVLSEEGTGSAADIINFLMPNGSYVPAYYALPLCEDGYRTYDTSSSTCARDDETDYNSGTLTYGIRVLTDDGFVADDFVSDDDESGDDSSTGSRYTNYSKLTDSYVVNARGGISWDVDNTHYEVTNVTALGCQNTFNLATGKKLSGCYADIQHGPAYWVTYESQNSIWAEITIIPYTGTYYNYRGDMDTKNNGSAAYLRGTGHVMTFYEGDGLRDQYGVDGVAYIQVGGDNSAYGSLLTKDNAYLRTTYIHNETMFPVRLGPNAGETGSGSNHNYICLQHGTLVAVEDESGNIVNATLKDTHYDAIIAQNYFYEYDRSVAFTKSVSGEQGSIVKFNGKGYFCAPGKTLLESDIEFFKP